MSPFSTPPFWHEHLATLSVVFASVFAPVGALVGHLGLSQIRRSAERGRERALVGVTLSYTIIVIAVVAVVIWAVTGGSSAPGVASSAPTAPSASSSISSAPKSSAPTGPLLDAAALPSLLLSLDEMRILAPLAWACSVSSKTSRW